jgi:hypothetical protein
VHSLRNVQLNIVDFEFTECLFIEYHTISIVDMGDPCNVCFDQIPTIVWPIFCPVGMIFDSAEEIGQHISALVHGWSTRSCFVGQDEVLPEATNEIDVHLTEFLQGEVMILSGVHRCVLDLDFALLQQADLIVI